MSSPWVVPSPAQKYGMGMVGQRASATESPLPALAGPAHASATTTVAWHPDSALFWFAVIAAAGVGLMGASTHVRVGPASAGAALGKD